MHLTDHRLGFGWEKRHVDRMARHQIGDEFLVDHGEVIGLGKIDFEKMLADGIPEGVWPRSSTTPRISAMTVGSKRSLCSAMNRKRRELEEASVAAAAIILAQEQAADFAGAAVSNT